VNTQLLQDLGEELPEESADTNTSNGPGGLDASSERPTAPALKALPGFESDTDEKLEPGLADARAALEKRSLEEADDALDDRSAGQLAPLEHAEYYDPRADQPTNPEGCRARMLRIIGALADFKNRRVPGLSRQAYLDYLVRDAVVAYGYSEETGRILLDLLGPSEFYSLLEACERPRPLVLRVNTLRIKRRDLAAALIARGVSLDPVGDWCAEGLQVHSSPVPLGATPEYLRGMYTIQDAASLLPTLALAPRPGERVMDMAAAPGGKTTHMAALMRNTGLIVANDPDKRRVAALQAAIARLGVCNTVVTMLDGRELPRATGNMDRILLDAPCSGLGVTAKDELARTRGLADLHRLSALQRDLLMAGLEMLSSSKDSPRLLCYSTCSVSVAENEAVVDFAVRSGAATIVPLPFDLGIPGHCCFRGTRYDPKMKLARRFYPHTHNTQGMFICLLQRNLSWKPDRKGAQKR